MKRTTPLRSRTRLRAVGARGRRLAPADRAWKAAVLDRDRVCRLNWCGGRESVDAHHIFCRDTAPTLRIDLSNGAGVCRHCHSMHKAHPSLVTHKLLRQMSKATRDRLCRAAGYLFDDRGQQLKEER